MSEVENDSPECRRRALAKVIILVDRIRRFDPSASAKLAEIRAGRPDSSVGFRSLEALQGAIDARQPTDEEQEIEDAAWRTRAERRDEICEKLTPAIIDALTPLAAKMPEGEPIRISVGGKISLTLGSKGVTREADDDIDDDIPF